MEGTGANNEAVFRQDQHLRDVIRRNRGGERVGTYAVCSAHPAVVDAAIRQALEDGTCLHVESTSIQVNQFGGYTGLTPQQFAEQIRAVAAEAGLPSERVLLGADHLGPFSWRGEVSTSAMAKACELARASVRAGYHKIHLDASMPCADDGGVVEERTAAERAAMMCQAAEEESQQSPGSRPLYVIGTEVPPPGGEVAEGACPPPTRIEDVQRSIETFRAAFQARGLEAAWKNVIALVVQPGVEFGDSRVFDYQRSRAVALSRGLPGEPALVYEAHSTDYQKPESLAQLVEDHFAILKVGPWLTFAYREAIFALVNIERESLGGKNSVQLSQVREVLDAEMVRNPSHWHSYYRGDEHDLHLARAYSFSDRCRYYWPQKSVQAEVRRLLSNLNSHPPALTLLSQYLTLEYEAVRCGELENRAEAIIRYHIQNVLRIYAAACGARRMTLHTQHS